MNGEEGERVGTETSVLPSSPEYGLVTCPGEGHGGRRSRGALPHRGSPGECFPAPALPQ